MDGMSTEDSAEDVHVNSRHLAQHLARLALRPNGRVVVEERVDGQQDEDRRGLHQVPRERRRTVAGQPAVHVEET